VRAVVLLVLGFVAALSCGGPTSARSATSREVAGLEGAATVPVQSVYGSDPAPDPIRGGPLAAELAGELREHLASLSLTGDGRLADVAIRVLAETQRRGKPVSVLELDAIARDAGFVGPVPTVFVVPRHGDTWDHLGEYLAMSPTNVKFTRYGVVVLDVGGAIAGAVALGAVHLTLEPVKRTVAVSERVQVRGSLAAGYTKGEVAWTRPDGSTGRTSAGDATFSFETPPLGKGIHRLEILAVGPSGLEVLANMPVACGVPLPSVETTNGAVDESDPKAALLELVNRERQKAGLRALEDDASLDGVAESHSKDMVDAHFFGHQSPTTGMVGDRLKAAGLRIALFGENVAKGPSMAEAHAMLLASPAHRANVLNARFTHVGIGVVAERSGDAPFYAVTEVFAGFPAPIGNLDGASGAAFSALNRSRAEARAPALVRAPELDRAAREIAEVVAASPTANPIAVAEPIIRQRVAGTHLRHPLLLTGLTLDPADLARDDRLKGQKLRAAGVAIAQSPPGGRPTTNVVVFLAAE